MSSLVYLVLSLSVAYSETSSERTTNVTLPDIMSNSSQLNGNMECFDSNGTAAFQQNVDSSNLTRATCNQTQDLTSSVLGIRRGPRIVDQGHLSKEQYDEAEVITRYLVYPLIASAITLNSLNILVYTDSSMKSPTSKILTALSVNELVFAVLSIPRPIMRSLYGPTAVNKEAYLYYVMYVSTFIMITIRRLMYCFTVLVSTERFIAVAFPLKARHFRLVKYPMIFVFATTCFCLICHLPGVFRFDIVQKPNSEDYTFKPTTFYLNNKSFVLRLSLANKIFYTYLVLLFGLLMNLLVLVAIKSHSKNRQKMQTTMDAGKASKRERQTTIAILTSTFLFTLLALPQATESIVSQFLPAYNLYQREHYINLLMKEVNAVLILSSLSTDFIFYVILSKAYRRTLCKKIPCLSRLSKQEKYLTESSRDNKTQMSTIAGTDVKNHLSVTSSNTS